MGLLIKMSQ